MEYQDGALQIGSFVAVTPGIVVLFVGIRVSNLVPKSCPRLSGKNWPSRGPAMALIADIVFLRPARRGGLR